MTSVLMVRWGLQLILEIRLLITSVFQKVFLQNGIVKYCRV